jgi:DNA mismatch endonuclease (patch repair protein)
LYKFNFAGPRNHGIRAAPHHVEPNEEPSVVDTLTIAQRSERMSRIRSKDTKPEMLVRHTVFSLGYRYRLHRRDLPGVPDLVFPSRRKAIFVHGCFWHGHADCKVANVPKTRRAYWMAKFTRNKKRDEANIQRLKKAGWDVCVIWECQTKAPASIAARVMAFLDTRQRTRAHNG